MTMKNDTKHDTPCYGCWCWCWCCWCCCLRYLLPVFVVHLLLILLSPLPLLLLLLLRYYYCAGCRRRCCCCSSFSFVCQSLLHHNNIPQYCICFVAMMKLVMLLFLRYIFVLLLPALELFLNSHHISAATADNDVVD